jgi:hypothetical protein
MRREGETFFQRRAGKDPDFLTNTYHKTAVGMAWGARLIPRLRKATERV